ncbi:MAG: redoxin domain-containing protein [Candidatus Anammoximicrobium sp.]|nr:redoxin domain-containing protein [Candidatus Anammoximicrobium sp.]
MLPFLRRLVCGGLLMGLVVGLGCRPRFEPGSSPAGGDQPGSIQDAAPAVPPAQSPAGPVLLRVADRQVYDEVLAKHRGQPILVDFWASWCVPCTEQFPHTVQLHAKYAARGLTVVSVSLDEPEDEASVRRFLEQQGATFDNLLSRWGGDDPSFEHFDIRAGTIPHYKLYDRDGQVVETFSVDPAAARQFTPADIEHSVVRLLEETP